MAPSIYQICHASIIILDLTHPSVYYDHWPAKTHPTKTAEWIFIEKKKKVKNNSICIELEVYMTKNK